MTRQRVADAPSADASSPQRRRRLPPILIWVPFAGILIVALGFVLSYALLYRSARIFPAVHAQNLALGQRTIQEAEAAIRAHWAGQSVAINTGTDTLFIPFDDLGVHQNSMAMANQAYGYGRDLRRPGAVLDALNGRIDLAPIYLPVDLDQADETLAALADDIYIGPVDATIAVVNGRAEAQPSRDGRRLNVAASADAWRAALPTILQTRAFDLVIDPVTPAVTDVSAFVAAANQRLQTPLQISAYDPIRDERITWNVSAAMWAEWLAFGFDGQTIRWEADRDAIAATLIAQDQQLDATRYYRDTAAEAIATAIERGDASLSLRIYHTPQTHYVTSGETLSSIGYDYGVPYPWLQAANPGVDALAVGQAIVIPSADDFLPLPPIEHKRIIISLSRQRLWAYEYGAVKWEWVISTGIAESPTHPGVFQVRSHESEAYAAQWDLYMPYFMGIYEPGPFGGVMNGFHGFPTRDGYNLLWTNNLGSPTTYGCILVDNAVIPALYAWAEAGTIVEIVP